MSVGVVTTAPSSGESMPTAGRGPTGAAAPTLASRSESLAVSRRTYTPGTLKDTALTAASGVSKITGPGPLTLPQPDVMVPPAGRPSSVTDPPRTTMCGGRVILWSGPALTT